MTMNIFGKSAPGTTMQVSGLAFRSAMNAPTSSRPCGKDMQRVITWRKCPGPVLERFSANQMKACQGSGNLLQWIFKEAEGHGVSESVYRYRGTCIRHPTYGDKLGGP